MFEKLSFILLSKFDNEIGEKESVYFLNISSFQTTVFFTSSFNSLHVEFTSFIELTHQNPKSILQLS